MPNFFSSISRWYNGSFTVSVPSYSVSSLSENKEVVLGRSRMLRFPAICVSDTSRKSTLVCMRNEIDNTVLQYVGINEGWSKSLHIVTYEGFA
jgi:hypothetical protein